MCAKNLDDTLNRKHKLYAAAIVYCNVTKMH